MEFLALWLRDSGESPHVIKEFGRGLRASTVRQYEAAWNSLGSFLAASAPRVMSAQLMRDFFSFLFRNKKLALSTIAAYKSALADPLSLAFGLDLQTRLFELQKRSFFSARPPVMSRQPVWSAHRVVASILARDFQSSPSHALRKMLFLVAMATGLRTNELASLRRSPALLRFRPGDAAVELFPTPGFLRKNEREHFRHSSVVVPALASAGHTVELCPVRAIRSYLSLTAASTSDCLFLDPARGVPLTPSKLASHLVALIAAANPEVRVRAHDTRKYAGSPESRRPDSGRQPRPSSTTTILSVYRRLLWS